MRQLHLIIVILCGLALAACSKKENLVFDNPADARGTNYVGHEVRDPKDPINVPSVAITDAPTMIKINVAYTYVATASDPNPAGLKAGRIVRYDWDFGDGAKKENASASEQHTYTKDGTYLVRVTVTDDDGNTTTSTRQVTVVRGKYPVAYPGGPYAVKINVPLTFNGTGNDSDGVVRNYEWDFDGDGAYDWSSATTGQTSHTYATANTYTARLRVMDDDSNSTTKTVQVTVTNYKPTAEAGGPYTIKMNSPLTLVGSASDRDGRIVSTGWDLDCDGTYETSGDTAAHTWTTDGSFWVRFRAVDDDGNATADSAQVTVTRGQSPVASITGGPYTVKINMPLTLRGSGTDADGRVVKYEWDFDGDGTYDWESATTGQASHTYATTNTYTASLRVTDDDGNADVKTVQVMVSSLPPVASVVGGPFTVKINMPLTLRGSGTDADGQVVKYEWDFDGDGAYDWSSTTTGQTSHTYTTAKTYTACLRVTDNDGDTDVKAVQVTVTNFSPVADPGGPYTVKINVPLAFNGSGTDPDFEGRVVKYEWDFDGDGAYDWSSATTGQTSHTYTTANTYTARLRVTDDDGNTATQTVQVTVTRGQSPVANPGGPYIVKINVSLTLNGSGTDADGRVVKYEWDFDGDGTYDWSSTTTGQTSHTYTTANTYTATLRVTDDDGNTNTKTVQVTVTHGQYPVAIPGGPYTVNTNALLTLYGSGTDADGQVVKYEWDFDGDGTYDWSYATSGQAGHIYAAGGVYTARLRVTDDDGNTAIGMTTVIVEIMIDFTQSSDLNLFTTHATTGTYAVVNGALRITGTSEGYIAEADLKDFTFTNGTIEVYIQWILGPTTYGYGLLFRVASSGNHYRFLIDADGYYIISKWINGTSQPLVDWTYTSAINKQGANTLKLVCQGSSITVYVNGTYLTQVSDNTHTSGSISLDVEGNGSVVEFDNLRVVPSSAGSSKPAFSDRLQPDRVLGAPAAQAPSAETSHRKQE